MVNLSGSQSLPLRTDMISDTMHDIRWRTCMISDILHVLKLISYMVSDIMPVLNGETFLQILTVNIIVFGRFV